MFAFWEGYHGLGRDSASYSKKASEVLKGVSIWRLHISSPAAENPRELLK